MTGLESIMAELKRKGSEKTRNIYSRHGMPIERMFGVSIADLKTIAKAIAKTSRDERQALAGELYRTGIMDAMYLAGILADGKQMTRKQLQTWADGAAGMQMISEYTVPWVTVENAEGRSLALDWIKSKKEHVATSGWCTYSGLLATTPDSSLDMAEIEELLTSVVTRIKGARNRERLTMNGFVISVGTYVQPMLDKAKAAAQKLGEVSVDMGETACKVPLATAYIAKIEAAGRVGKKRRTIRC
jgi:3-methyladenine DNA glycosylase AlkD